MYAIPVKDGEGGQRAGPIRQGQTYRQPDAKGSASWLEPSPHQALAWLEKGARPQWGNPGLRPGAGGLTSKPATCCNGVLGAALAPQR